LHNIVIFLLTVGWADTAEQVLFEADLGRLAILYAEMAILSSALKCEFEALTYQAAPHNNCAMIVTLAKLIA